MSRPLVIDARLNAYRQGGIARYTQALVHHMVRQAPDEDWLVLTHRRMAQWPDAAVRTLRAWTPPHHRWEQLSLPLELLRARPRLLHSPDFIPPLRRCYPAVITVHDLAFRLFPEILDAAAKRYYGQIDAAVRSASRIIVDSHSTAADLTRLLDVDPARLHVIHLATDMQPLSVVPDEERQIGAHTLRAGQFMTFVSTIEPRKNIPMLLQAMRVVVERQPRTAYRLVLAGNRGWLDSEVFALIKELRLDAVVLFAEAPSDAEVRWLLSACRCYVNPSRYEGFGLPALEALACGAPALVSNASSLPEVVGDAALLLPPDDVQAWADSIERLWHDGDLRAELRRRGPAQAATFSWQRTAAQTLAVYRAALSAAE